MYKSTFTKKDLNKKTLSFRSRLFSFKVEAAVSPKIKKMIQSFLQLESEMIQMSEDISQFEKNFFPPVGMHGFHSFQDQINARKVSPRLCKMDKKFNKLWTDMKKKEQAIKLALFKSSSQKYPANMQRYI